MGLFRAIAKFVRARASRALARAVGTTFTLAGEIYDSAEGSLKFHNDLSDCWAHNPSVVKRDIGGERVWEMYHSNSGNVYVYFPPTGERRIYYM